MHITPTLAGAKGCVAGLQTPINPSRSALVLQHNTFRKDRIVTSHVTIRIR